MFKFKSKPKEVSPLISAEQIHKEVYSAQDILINEAEQISKYILGDSEKANTAKKLYDLGFFRAEGIGKPVEALSLFETIQIYQKEYVNYKFINKESVERICNKYNLYQCRATDYISDIPAKNQKEIIEFKVKEKHIPSYYLINQPYYSDTIKHNSEAYKQYLQDEEKYKNEVKRLSNSDMLIGAVYLEIIAPQDKINMTHKRIVGRQIVAEDPIVLHPVHGGYLIVTAWGDEASDKLVINEKMN